MNTSKSRMPAGLKITEGEAIAGKKVRLREKMLSDARNDYAWQSDEELAALDAAPVLNVSFPLYLLEYTEQLNIRRPNRYPMSIETLDGRHIGNCTCYDIDEWKGETQFGVMIGDRRYWDRGYGTDAVRTVIHHVFLNTDLKRIYLKTLDWNLRAQKCFQNCGFTAYGYQKRNGHSFVLMELRREQWLKPPERAGDDGNG